MKEPSSFKNISQPATNLLPSLPLLTPLSRTLQALLQEPTSKLIPFSLLSSEQVTTSHGLHLAAPSISLCVLPGGPEECSVPPRGPGVQASK